MGRRYDHVGLAEPLAACWAAIPQQLAQNVGRMLYPPVVSSTILIDTLVLYVYPQILLKNQYLSRLALKSPMLIVCMLPPEFALRKALRNQASSGRHQRSLSINQSRVRSMPLAKVSAGA